jgi:glycosyltransferase involved in cell wall biosynthesis
MKIIIIGTAYPLRGGIAHFNALLAQHLAKHHTVETITFKRQYPSLLFPGKTQSETGAISENVKPAPELVDSINPFNWFSVAREVAARKPDLIIFKYWLPFFGPCFGTIAKLAKKNSGCKVLFICDNIIPHEKRPGDVLFTQYAFRQADCCIVQSDAVENDLLKYFPEIPYKKVPHPVYENFGTAIPKNVARSALGISSKKVILFFGYVRAYKGLMVLIDSMKHLVGEKGMNDIRLLVVGEFYDDEEKYRKHVHELGITEYVQFIADYIPNNKVAEYFSAADVVVLPYLSATQSGIAQIAYNFDTPVIATRVGGLAEVVKDEVTGFVVEPNNPVALSTAIYNFYTGQKEIQFTANVQTEKHKYSWDNLVTSIEELVVKI